MMKINIASFIECYPQKPPSKAGDFFVFNIYGHLFTAMILNIETADIVLIDEFNQIMQTVMTQKLANYAIKVCSLDVVN